MKDRILVVGGAGFIGSQLVNQLLKLNYNITVFDNLSEQIHGQTQSHSIPEAVKFYLGDVRSPDALADAMQNQDIIIHLAAETGTGQSMYQISKYVEVNSTGTANILDIIVNQKLDIKKFIIASSRSLYGEGKYKCAEHNTVYPGARNIVDLSQGDFNVKCPFCKKNVEPMPTDELSRIHPESVYALTKFNQEQMALLVGQTIAMPVIGLRFQNVYGPGQSLRNPYTGILSIFSTRIRNGNKINIFEDGLESRDFIYIDDVVKSIVLAIETSSATHDVFNVGSSIPISVNEVVKQLMQALQLEVDVSISGDYRLGDIRHNFADISKIKSMLGFVPAVSFVDGLQRFVDWVLSQDIMPDTFERSYVEMQRAGVLK